MEFLAWLVLLGGGASLILSAFVSQEQVFRMFGVESWPEVWRRITGSRVMAWSVAVGMAAEVAALVLAVVVLF